MIIDCDTCEVRGAACTDCVIGVLLGAPGSGSGGASDDDPAPDGPPPGAPIVQLDAPERRAAAVITMRATVAKNPAAMRDGASSLYTYRRQGDTLTLTEVRTPAGPSAQPIAVTLTRVESRTHDAKTFRFAIPQGRELRFAPGQFLTFDWVVDGTRAIRSYSICSSSAACRRRR